MGAAGRRDRWLAALCCLALAVAMFADDPGRIVGDTKLDLSIDPAAFLSAATRLWQPEIAFGELQNQAYGYLFPMGPFFALAHGAGIPSWVTQRLWQSALLVAAFLGLRLLAGRLGIGTASTRLIGGLAYALSPFVLSHLGPISSEAQPECLAPWVLVPLVGAGASERPRRAACASGVALLLVGGVNASATLAVLVLPVLWFVLCRVRRALVGWWVLAVVLASAWWALPLVQLGRYSAPFTDWIESAATTTSSTSLLATMQGTADWVGHILTGDGPQWPAAWLYVSRPPLVLASVGVVAIGVLGLTRRDLPARSFLVTSFVLGAALVAFGHSGPGTTSLGGAERSALDGPLVAFRNVVKFDVVLRIPLALGLVHACAALGRRQWSVWRSRLPGSALVAAVLVAVLGSAYPLWSGQVEPAGSFTRIPSWWYQATAWLAAHDAGGGRALLLPASQHPDYVWGFPTDEPFQVLSTTPWAVRDAAVLGGAGEARLLDAVDAVVGSGQGSPGLAAYLARAGVQWLVVRNDLDRGRENGSIPSPLVVQGAIEGSAGLRRVAAFGPSMGPSSEGPTVLEGGTPLALPAVEIFEVSGPVAQVVSYPLATTLRVSGGPESLLELADLGLLPPGQATVMAADPVAPGTDPGAERPVVTDGYRRQEVNVGRASNNVSATLLPGQPWSQPRAVHDYLIGDPAGHQTVAVFYGVAEVGASSSASDADAARDFDSEYSAAAAFDGNPGDAWVNGSEHAVGQWVQEQFLGDPVVRSVTISTPATPGTGSQVSEVQVRTDAGNAVLALPASTAPHDFAVPAGRTRWVRVTILAVRGGGLGGAAALKVAVAGIAPADKSLRVPDDADPRAGPPELVFAAEPGQDDGCVALEDPPADVCDPTLFDSTEDSLGIDRTFTLAGPARYRIAIDAVARSGAALGAVLPTAGGVRVTASSQRVPDPSDDPETLFEGDPTAGWVASAQDPDPRLTLVLPRRSMVRAVLLERSATLRASSPSTVELRSGARSETAVVLGGEAVLAHPMAGRVFVLSFPRVDWRTDITDQGVTHLPVGLSRLRLLAAGLVTKAPAMDASVVLRCGAGPLLRLDGTTSPTMVRGTLAAVLDKAALSVVPCSRAGSTLELPAGSHQLRLLQNAAVTPDAVVMTPLGSARSPGSSASSPTAARTRSVRVLAWGDESRVLRVGPGVASFIVVRENVNAGWVATLGGRQLAAGIVDGWQQAFVLPAGAGGVVRLQYAPNGPFRIGLLAGALAAILLVMLAAIPMRRRRRSNPAAGAPAVGAPAASVPAAGLAAGPPAVRASTAGPAVGAPAGRTRLGGSLAAAVVVLVGLEIGVAPLVAALIGGALYVLASANRRRLAGCQVAGDVVAVGGIVIAAMISAVHPQGRSTAPASGDLLVQALCLLCMLALALSLLGTGQPDDPVPAPAGAASATAAVPALERPEVVEEGDATPDR